MVFYDKLSYEEFAALGKSIGGIVPREFYTIKTDYGVKGTIKKYLVSRVEIQFSAGSDFECLFIECTDNLLRVLEICKVPGTVEYLCEQVEEVCNCTQEEAMHLLYSIFRLRLLVIGKDEEAFRSEYAKTGFIKASPLCMEILYSYISKKFGIPYMFAPSKFTFVVTNKCNAKCKTCYRGSISGNKERKYTKELTTDEIKEVIDYLKAIGTDRVKFLGGEPFCREDIFEILDYAHAQNMMTEISTNGLMLAKDEYLDQIEKLNPKLLNIQISIDGLEESQNLQRAGASFTKVVEAMDKLTERKIDFTTNTIVSRVNMNEIEDFAKFLSKYNIYSRFQIMKACGTGAENFSMIPSPAEKKAIIAKIDEVKEKYHLDINNSVIFHPFARTDIAPRPDLTATYHRCRACTYGMAVDPEGYAMPCEFLEPFPNFIVENIKDVKILDIWHKNELFRRLRYVKVNGRCAKCEYSYNCEMGCFSETYGIVHNINASDPVCWYEPGSNIVEFPNANDYIAENARYEIESCGNG